MFLWGGGGIIKNLNPRVVNQLLRNYFIAAWYFEGYLYPLQGLEKLRKQVEEPAGPLSEGEKSAWVAEKGKEVDREAFKIFCFKAKAVSVQSKDKKQK